MGSSLARVYIAAKVFPVESFEHEQNKNKNDMVANMATFLVARGVLWMSSCLGNLKPSVKKPLCQISCLH